MDIYTERKRDTKRYVYGYGEIYRYMGSYMKGDIERKRDCYIRIHIYIYSSRNREGYTGEYRQESKGIENGQ